jgi:superfamily II DNA or RNA helicase
MSGIILRPYQQKSVDEVRSAFQAGHDAVLLQLPTGGGKTLTSGYIIGAAAAKGNPGWFICNRVELVEQTALAFDRLGLDGQYGIIAAGYTANPRSMIQICSVDTLKSRLKKPEEARKFRFPKLRVWDECRSVGSAGWTAVYERLKAEAGGMDLGLDATPTRLDGKGLDAYFSHLVQGPMYSELMGLGSLVPFEVFGVGAPDLSGVKMKGGEFDQDQVESIFDKPTLVGDVARHYHRLAAGKQGITFAVSRKHSEHLAESYRASGIRAVHVDGETDKYERKRIINAFRRREIDILCNVDLFTAGFDAPGVEVITMVRPTQSLSVYLQQAGRGSRPEPSIGKTHCTMIDHAGNWFRHGLPDADRSWSLQARSSKQRKADIEEAGDTVRQCTECYKAFPAKLTTCPNCASAATPTPREVKQVEGELRRIDAEEAARVKEQQKREVKGAKTIEELKRIERERGYKPGWAEGTFSARRKVSEKYSQKRAEAQFEAYRR